MNKLKNITITIVLIISIWGCNELRLEDALGYHSPRLVVDGSIEQGQFAFVALTLSASYLKDVDRDDLIRSSVVDAKVTVSDGEESEVLTLRRNTKNFPELIYRSSDIKGEVGKTYDLKIEYKGETYLSTTTIPEKSVLDSLWFEADKKDTTKLFLKGTITDTPDRENYYRIFTKRIGKDTQFIPMYLSTIADNFFDGNKLNFTIFRGVQNLSETRNDGFFEVGDSVQVRFSSIDKEHFDFWSTAEREIYSFSNPFSSSGNEIIFNVDNNAIGIWGGYASVYYTLNMGKHTKAN